MFKKLISHLMLIGFFNHSCVEPAIASMHTPELKVPHKVSFHLNEDVNKNGELVLGGDVFKHLDRFHNIDLIHSQEKVGLLIYREGNLVLQGLNKHSFYIKDLPALRSLNIDLNGTVTFENKVICNQFVNVESKGSSFLSGFHVESEGGAALFKTDTLKLNGDSYAKNLRITNLQHLLLHRNSSMRSDLFISQGVIQSFKILGELISKESCLNPMIAVSCEGTLDLGKGNLQADKITNKGKFKAANVAIQKTSADKSVFVNESRAEFTATSSFHANVNDYRDAGTTSVYGLATIDAHHGYMTGRFSTRNALIAFQNSLSLPKELCIQDHLSVYSGEDLVLNYDIVSHDFSKDWSPLEITPTLRESFRDLQKLEKKGAWFFSAAKDISNKGYINGKNKKFHFKAGGKYLGDKAKVQAGYFKDNDLTIEAHYAKLGEDIRAYGNLTLTAETANLMGSRQIDGLFKLQVGNLNQREGDENKVGCLVGRADNAKLAGNNEFKERSHLKVTGLYQTTPTLHSAGAGLNVDAGTAELAGRQKDPLQVKTKGAIRLKKGFHADGFSSDLQAGTYIIHESGSKLRPSGLNSEDAGIGIALDTVAEVKAHNNLLSARSWIFNAGSIESDNLYQPDTAFHFNMFGGRIKSRHNDIRADYLNANVTGFSSSLDPLLNYLDLKNMGLNCFDIGANNSGLLSGISTVTGENTAINTLFNLNSFGLIRGSDQLNVNGGINFNTGLYLSRNVSINTAVDINPKSLFRVATGIDLSALTNNPIANKVLNHTNLGMTLFDPIGLLQSGDFLNNFKPSSLVNPALTMLAGAFSGSALLSIKAAQLTWNLYGVGKVGWQLWNVDHKGDEENYWRMSRIAKRAGDYAGLGIQAYQNGKEAMELGKLYNEIYYPVPLKEKDKKKDTQQQADEKKNDSEKELNTNKNPQQTNDTKDQPNEDEKKQGAPKPLTLLEKLWEQVNWENLQNVGMNFIPGTSTTNALFGSGNGFTIMPHIVKRNGYLSDNNVYVALDRSIKAYKGEDHSKTLAKTNSVTTVGDLINGAKFYGSQNSVHAGGDLLNTEGLSSQADSNNFKADGKMTTEKGAYTKAKINIFKSKGDNLFEGVSEAEYTLVESEEGRADGSALAFIIAVEGGTPNDKPNILFKGKTGGDVFAKISGKARVYAKNDGHVYFRPDMEGTNIAIDAPTYQLGGIIHLSQKEYAMYLKGEGTCDDNLKLRIGEEEVEFYQALNDSKIALAKMENAVLSAAKDVLSAANDTSEQADKPRDEDQAPKAMKKKKNIAEKALEENPDADSRSKNGKHKKRHKNGKSDKRKGSNKGPEPSEVIETAEADTTTDEAADESNAAGQDPGGPAPGKPAEATKKPAPIFSIYVEGSFIPNGTIAASHGMYILARPNEGEQRPSGEQLPVIRFGDKLNMALGGDLIVDTDGEIAGNANAEISVANEFLDGDQGVSLDGITKAVGIISATSINGCVTEKDGSRATAGILLKLDGKTLVKEEKARGNAQCVLRNGKEGGRVAGILEAGEYLQTTTGDNKDARLIIADNTIFDAPHGKTGSYGKDPEPESEKPNSNPEQQSETTDAAQKQQTSNNKKHHHKKKQNHIQDLQAFLEENLYLSSRSKTEPKPKKDNKQDKAAKEEPTPQHTPGPYDDLPPIDNAGKIVFGENVTFKGNTHHFRGRGIKDIQDLFEQTGVYSNFKIKDSVRVHTNQHVTFDHSANSAANSFQLHTNQITVMPGVKLKAPQDLMLHSTEEDMAFGYRTKLIAGNYLELVGKKDILGEYNERIIENSDGTQTVKFKGATFISGQGYEYDYVDPETGQKEKRRLGFYMHADGKIHGTGMHFAGAGYMRLHGHEGVKNKGASQLYISKLSEEENLWRTKKKVNYETEFFAPAISTNGKLMLSTDNGPIEWHAGAFLLGGGADINSNGHDVYLPYLKGKRGHTTTRDTKITFLDSEDQKVEGLAQTTLFWNQSDAKVRIWSVDKNGTRGNINAPGFNYVGEEGTLQMIAHDGHFSKPKLNHYSYSKSAKASVDFGLISHLKSLQALQSAKDVLSRLNQSDLGSAFSDIVKPSLTANLDWTFLESSYQTLGAGGIREKRLEWDFTGDVTQDNAFSLDIKKGGYIKIAGTWYQNGAKLKYENEMNSFGVYAGASESGASAGVRYSHSETKGHNGVFGQNKFGDTMHYEVNNLEQNGFVMNTDHGTGFINNVKSTTPQDESETKGWGGSVGYGNASANGHYSATRKANNKSGIHFKSTSDDFRVGHADLHGSEITGATPLVTTYTPLPGEYENRGGSLGFGFNKKGLSSVNAGVFDKGREVGFNLGVQRGEKDPNQPLQLWDSVGDVYYIDKNKGLKLFAPLITDINKDAWQEFCQDLKDFSHVMNDNNATRTHEMPNHVESVQQQRGEWVLIEEQPLEPEVPTVDLPYEEMQPQVRNPVETTHDKLDVPPKLTRHIPFNDLMSHVEGVLTPQKEPLRIMQLQNGNFSLSSEAIGSLQEKLELPEWPMPEFLADMEIDFMSQVLKRPIRYTIKKAMNAPGWLFRLLSLGGKIMPEIADQEWETTYNEWIEAKNNGDNASMNIAAEKLQVIKDQKQWKFILTIPDHVANGISAAVDFFLPDLADEHRVKVKDMGPIIGSALYKYLDDTAASINKDPIQSAGEFQTEIDAYIDRVLPQVAPGQATSGNFRTFYNKVENILGGSRQGAIGMATMVPLATAPYLSSSTGVPFSGDQRYPIISRSPSTPTPGNSGVEQLYKPFSLDGAEYKFRKGNLYLQSEGLIEPFEIARQRILSSNSGYGQRALFFFDSQQTPLFLRNAHQLQDSLGFIDPNGVYKGTQIHGPKGTSCLGKVHIELATFPKGYSLYETFAHELEHNRWFSMYNGESLIPGFVSGNPKLTEANRTMLLKTYAHEYINLESQRRLHGQWTPEAKTFFNAYGYFENTLMDKLNGYSIPLPTDIEGYKFNFLEEAYYGRRLSCHPALHPELRYPIWLAENTVALEIPAHLAQIDVKNPRWIYGNAAKTHELLEELGKSAFKAPSPKPVIFDSKLPSAPASPCTWQGLKKLGKFGIPLLDWGFHVGSEALSGHHLADSMLIGSAKTVVDTGVYGGFYGAFGYFAGGPAAWTVGGLMAADSVLPSYTHQEIYDVFKGSGEFDGAYSHELAESMVALNAIHEAIKWSGIRWIGEKLHTGSEFVYHKFDDTFPTALPFVSACMRYAQIRELNENARYLESMGFVSDQLPVRNPREIFEEVDIKYKASLNEKKSASSSDKGKEEL